MSDDSPNHEDVYREVWRGWISTDAVHLAMSEALCRCAVEITHECGTAEASLRAYSNTVRDFLRRESSARCRQFERERDDARARAEWIESELTEAKQRVTDLCGPPWHFRCPECGAHVAADEDGCCTTCGADCSAETCDCIDRWRHACLSACRRKQDWKLAAEQNAAAYRGAEAELAELRARRCETCAKWLPHDALADCGICSLGRGRTVSRGVGHCPNDWYCANWQPKGGER